MRIVQHVSVLTTAIDRTFHKGIVTDGYIGLGVHTQRLDVNNIFSF